MSQVETSFVSEQSAVKVQAPDAGLAGAAGKYAVGSHANVCPHFVNLDAPAGQVAYELDVGLGAGGTGIDDEPKNRRLGSAGEAGGATNRVAFAVQG